MKFNLLTILEIKHVDRDGRVLWEAKNLKNVFHTDGEEYILRAVFTGGQSNTFIPENYYFGLDSRDSLSVLDDMQTIAVTGNEPSGSGYFRQAVASADQFTIGEPSEETGWHRLALSPIVTFTASGSSWTAANLFLATTNDNSGYLISSVQLPSIVIVESGQGIHMRMSLGLGNDPTLPPLPTVI